MASESDREHCDVYPRSRGAARDAYRIVVNRSTKETWFTPDHYVTFYKL
jgi:ribonuclease T1